MLWTPFVFSVNVVVPLYLVILLGRVLRSKGSIAEQTSEQLSTLLYKFFMPAMLFINTAEADILHAAEPKMILFLVVSSIIQVSVVWIVGACFIKSKPILGSLVHGSYRCGFAFFGISLIKEIFGDSNIASASVFLAATLLLYSFMGVVVLTACGSETNIGSFWKSTIGFVKNIMTNPFIVAILLGLPFSLLEISLPTIVTQALNYLGDMSTPIAMLTIGASVSAASIRKNLGLSILGAAWKAVVTPLIITPIAVLLGFRDLSLAIIAISAACPTATTTHVLAKGFKCDGDLAANIILLSTAMSVFSMTAVIYFLRVFRLI